MPCKIFIKNSYGYLRKAVIPVCKDLHIISQHVFTRSLSQCSKKNIAREEVINTVRDIGYLFLMTMINLDILKQLITNHWEIYESYGKLF